MFPSPSLGPPWLSESASPAFGPCGIPLLGEGGGGGAGMVAGGGAAVGVGAELCPGGVGAEEGLGAAAAGGGGTVKLRTARTERLDASITVR